MSNIDKRNKLIEENIMLYYKFINQFLNSGYHPNLLELINHKVLLGYINACDKFDTEHSTKAQFQTLAWKSMNNQFINALKHNNTEKAKVGWMTESIDANQEQQQENARNGHHAETRSIEPYINDNTNNIDNCIIEQAIKDKINSFNEVDKKIYEDYESGLIMATIAKKYNLSTSRVQQKISIMVNDIKEHLQDGYL